VTYGLAFLRGKAAAGFLLIASPVCAEPVTVLALGDSLTQGYGLVQEDGFVPQLGRWLAEAGEDVQMINGGVSGDTTAGGAARVRWSLTPEVDVMIVALGGNDLLRGIDPAVSRANLDMILSIAAEENMPVLLVGLQAPGNYGPDYKAAFDSIYPELAEAYGTTYFENFFAGLNDSSLETQMEFFQADGIHPNAQGVTRIVESLGPVVQQLVTLD